MYRKLEDFNKDWKISSEATEKIFAALTDESLKQSVAEGHRTLGRIAWHIVQTLPEMCNRTGLNVDGPSETDPVPEKSTDILAAYRAISDSLCAAINSSWDDESLMTEDDLYGEMWKRGVTLRILIDHEIHHRGQMTVLMRQAGLEVPGVFGPSLEEWEKYGMSAPKI